MAPECLSSTTAGGDVPYEVTAQTFSAWTPAGTWTEHMLVAAAQDSSWSLARKIL